MSNLNKQAIINLENTAYYQSRSDLNIAFSTADRDSAVFRFNVTKNNKPLLLSEQNVLGHIAFSHSDKSFVKTTLDFTEHDINGQFKVNVPNDLLKRPGTVTMQVYVAEKGNSEVIVAERILTFKIEKSIVSEISAETSLQYIIEFDELLEQVNQRMIAINDSMANAEDYVNLINQAKEQGLSDIEIARLTSTQEINALVANKLEELETKGNQYSTKFDNDKAEMDSKKQAFDLAVQGSGLVTTGQSSNWQKVKITNDDGTTPLFSDFDFSNPDYALTKTPGTYYVRGGLNSSANGISSNYGYLTISKTYSNGSVAELIYRPIGTTVLNNGEIYTCRKNTEWGSWTFVGVDPNETETITGSQSKANIAESNAKTYANELVDKKTTLLFEGTANGVGKTINLSESMDNFYVLIIYASTPGGNHVDIVSPYGSEKIFIKSVNLPDNGNTGGAIFECGIDKTYRNQLTIVHDVFLDLSNFQGSGPDANRVTINRIVGVRK